MERRLKVVEELLEIVLNFLVVICIETAAQAVAGGRASMYILLVPAIAPFVFYAARKWVGSLILFLIVHAAVVCGLYYLAGYMTGGVLWQIGYVLIGICYSLHSVRIRVTKEEDGEGEIPPAMAAGVAIVAFFLCGMQDSDEGCSRILWICLIWLSGFLIRKYLSNYSSYVALNRNTAGTMPEERIFRNGAGMVGLYGALSLLLLCAGSKTSLVSWLSGTVKSGVRIVLRAFLYFLELLSGIFGTEAVGEGGGNEMLEMMEALEADAPPAWMQLLEKLLVAAVLVLAAVGVLFLVYLLIRFLIRGFYSRGKKEQRIEEKGYVEEEERLERKDGRSREYLPFIGKTPNKRVRRLFRKTVLGTVKSREWEEISSMTARQLAELSADAPREPWTELILLYERARYTEKEITMEDARRAGKLSRQILHTIK